MSNLKAKTLVASILLIVFLIQPSAQMGVVEANPLSGPFILIYSPVNYESGMVYQNSSVDLSIQINRGFTQNNSLKGAIDVFYSLDRNSNVDLALLNDYNFLVLNATGKLENLTDGHHTLSISVIDTLGRKLSISTTFLVNSTFSYPQLLVSPINSSYGSSNVSLAYFVTPIGKYVCYYALDSSNEMVLTGNTTLSGLSEGQHKIAFKAIDNGRIYSEQTVYFSIDTTKSNQPAINASQITIIGIAASVVVVGSVVAIIVFRRRKAHRISGERLES